MKEAVKVSGEPRSAKVTGGQRTSSEVSDRVHRSTSVKEDPSDISGAMKSSSSKPTTSPAGGPSTGSPSDQDMVWAAVWSYVHGYLHILLAGPPLVERLSQLSAAAGGQLASCRQLLLLCPSDGRGGTEGVRLETVGRAAPFLSSVAGARSREYGAHTVYRISRHSPAESSSGSPSETSLQEERLAAVESVGSLRTLCAVAEAMAAGGRLPSLPADVTSRLAGLFVTRLRDAVSRDPRLRDAFRLVQYDPRRPGALEAALQDAAFGEDEHGEQPTAPAPAPAPGGLGVYLAWSFLHGYLKMTAGRKDFSEELKRKRLTLEKVIVLCRTSVSVWSDDISQLDGKLKPVLDVDGVKMSSRSYGSFTIYSSSSGGHYALELATPLRTLHLGITSSGLEQQVYHQEAVSFTEELQKLLTETPDVAAHCEVLRVDSQTDISRELERMAAEQEGELAASDGGFRRTQEVPRDSQRWTCALL